jgi:hypothetical protein
VVNVLPYQSLNHNGYDADGKGEPHEKKKDIEAPREET